MEPGKMRRKKGKIEEGGERKKRRKEKFFSGSWPPPTAPRYFQLWIRQWVFLFLFLSVACG